MASKKAQTGSSSNTMPDCSQEFTDACKDLILLSANGSLNENDNEMIELMANCSDYFLRKLVVESASIAETPDINYDDIAELVHSEPWLSVLRESFRKRISLEEIISRRKRTMKAQWFFDYTHFNKHNKEEEQGLKNEKSQNKLVEKKEEPVSVRKEEFSSKKRRIIPKKHLYE